MDPDAFVRRSAARHRHVRSAGGSRRQAHSRPRESDRHDTRAGADGSLALDRGARRRQPPHGHLHVRVAALHRDHGGSRASGASGPRARHATHRDVQRNPVRTHRRRACRDAPRLALQLHALGGAAARDHTGFMGEAADHAGDDGGFVSRSVVVALPTVARARRNPARDRDPVHVRHLLRRILGRGGTDARLAAQSQALGSRA